MKMRNIAVFLAFSVTTVCISAAAPPTRPTKRPETMSEIVEQMASADAAVRQQAMDALRARVQTPRGVAELRSVFIKQLASTGQHKEICDVAPDLAIAAAGDTRALEAILQMRIKSLLALGRNDEALSEARSLFNVSSMLSTSDAILTVSQCLNVARGNDPALFNKFRDEQMAGATTRPAFDTSPENAKKSSIMLGIKIIPTVYAEAARKITGEDAPSLLAKGNLLLMAGDTKAAREVFERMYSLTSSDIIEASEALARCMKAEDGTIGRANTWILSIRPKSGR